MGVSLAKEPRTRWGTPMRPHHALSANCLLRVHRGDAVKRMPTAYVEPCDGTTTVLGRPRECACACHTEHTGRG